MRKSIYNHLSNMYGCSLLYNTLSDEMAILDPTLLKMYQDRSIDDIRDIHPQFHQFLSQKGFIVNDNTDEFQSCIDKWDKEDNDPSHFTITVNPTLDCNMRCWYCYEKHDASRTMSQHILSRVFRLINIKTSERELKHLCLSFFGGEPLMKFSGVIKPLIEHALFQCREHNKKLSIGFVTNASLLSPKVITFLKEIDIPTHLQITMDGNRTVHNKIRHTTSGFGSYDLILKNMNNVSTLPNVSITLRLNYTHENIDSFVDLAEDLSSICESPQNRFSIDLQQVWQDSSTTSLLLDKVERVKAAFVEHGYNVSGDKSVVKYRCYADSNNHIVVNYDGNIYHCTARDFTPDKSEGTLTNEGKIIENDNASLRSSLKWGNDACRICKAYPLCHGGCSQHKLDMVHVYGCIESYDNHQVDELIEKRIKYLINSSKVCANHNN